jgi:hypothetical protein
VCGGGECVPDQDMGDIVWPAVSGARGHLGRHVQEARLPGNCMTQTAHGDGGDVGQIGAGCCRPPGVRSMVFRTHVALDHGLSDSESWHFACPAEQDRRPPYLLAPNSGPGRAYQSPAMRAARQRMSTVSYHPRHIGSTPSYYAGDA